MAKRKDRKPLIASCDRPQLSTTIRWKRIRPTCSKQLASVSITPRPTSSPSLPLSLPLPACLVHLRRALKHALSGGRARMYVSLRMCSPCAWTRGGLAPPGLGLYSHVRSDDPGLPACQGNIILGDDAYTPHEEAISRGSGR